MRRDRAEVARDRLAGELGDRAGHLDAGRAAADHDEGQQRLAALLVGLGLGPLEREQHLAAHRGRVVDRLDAGRMRGPVVAAEIGVARAGGEDQPVVGDAARRCRAAPACCAASTPVDPVEQHAGVAVARRGSSGSARRCRPATGRRSRPGRARAGTGDGCAGRSSSRRPAPFERLRRGEAAEAGADDDHAGTGAAHCRPRPLASSARMPGAALARADERGRRASAAT